ncbi:MAG: hypothetical protein H0U04_07980 [Rubrobacter sp.]|nr:hypothetical protein [Rubrobacter sp.]
MDQAMRTNGSVRTLSDDEGRELFDRQARRYLDMTGDEFVEAWDARKFDDPDNSPDIMHVAMLLPLVR